MRKSIDHSSVDRYQPHLGARALALPLLSPLSSLLPVYLTGTLAAELNRSLGLTVERLGLATAIYFLAAALSSYPLGRLAARFGSVRSMQIGVAISVLATGLTAALASSWIAVVACLAVNGVAQALVDPASGMYLTRAIPPEKQGLAFGLKLASIPAGTLLCGLALPLVAVPFGWRWVFGGVALLMALPLVASPSYRPTATSEPRVPPKVSVDRLILALTAGAALGFAAANIFAAFIVSSASSSGMSPAAAGGLVALGGLLGAVARIVIGRRADRRPETNLKVTQILITVGATGFVSLATGSEVAHWIVIPVAFITVWGWAPLYQIAVTARFRASPASALRIINSGIYVSSVICPLAFGWLASPPSFTSAWIMTGALAAGSVLAFNVSARLMARPQPVIRDAGADLPTARSQSGG